MLRHSAKVFRTTRQSCLPYLPVLHTADEDGEFFEARVLQQDSVWIAEDAGRIVGFCAFRNEWLDHLYVDPAFQRRGIGRALLDLAISQNRVLNLWVFQQNLPAIAFTSRMAFVSLKIPTDPAMRNAFRMRFIG